MSKKTDNLKELEIWTDLHFMTKIVHTQIKKRKTEKLELMSDALIRIASYFQEYSNNMRIYKKALSDYRSHRNKAIVRSRKAEKQLEELKLKLKKYANI